MRDMDGSCMRNVKTSRAALQWAKRLCGSYSKSLGDYLKSCIKSPLAHLLAVRSWRIRTTMAAANPTYMRIFTKRSPPPSSTSSSSSSAKALVGEGLEAAAGAWSWTVALGSVEAGSVDAAPGTLAAGALARRTVGAAPAGALPAGRS
jgi:hypothetical protein